jgi:hypothetical protein
MNRSEVIPVVFIHKGHVPVYLIYSALLALKYGNDVYIITDSDIRIGGVKVLPFSSYNKDESDFKKVYRHQSSNSFEFEFICIYRWLVLRNFMTAQNFEKVVYLDSDTSIYAHTADIVTHYAPAEFGYNVPMLQSNFHYAGAACCSIWTIDSLSKFSELILSHYQATPIKEIEEKWNYHVENKVPGGICDMTFLYFFSKTAGFYPLGQVCHGISIDYNNMVASNYLEDEYDANATYFGEVSSKVLKFRKGIPFGYNQKLGTEVRFFAVAEYSKLLFLYKKTGPDLFLYFRSMLTHKYLRLIARLKRHK